MIFKNNNKVSVIVAASSYNSSSLTVTLYVIIMRYLWEIVFLGIRLINYFLMGAWESTLTETLELTLKNLLSLLPMTL